MKMFYFKFYIGQANTAKDKDAQITVQTAPMEEEEMFRVITAWDEGALFKSFLSLPVNEAETKETGVKDRWLNLNIGNVWMVELVVDGTEERREVPKTPGKLKVTLEEGGVSGDKRGELL